MKRITMLETYKVQEDYPDEVKRAYEDIYSGRARVTSSKKGIRHLDSFYRWILKSLRPAPGRTLLDVACGEGVLPTMAQAFGLRAFGTDIAEAAVRIAAKESSTRYTVSNGEHLPFSDGVFDYVTNIGSLEHYVDMEQGVREIARVLAPDGLACFLLPNTFSLLANVLYAWHTGRTSDDGQPIQRYAARYEWQDLIEAHGLQVVRTYKYESESPVSLGDLIWYLQRPKSLIRLLLAPLLPINLANCFLYICRKRKVEPR